MDHFTDDAREQRGVGWLILCVSLTEPRDPQIAGQTLFLVFR